MTTQDFKRKLTAILSADVQGYSRLMSKDEVATVRTLNVYREMMSVLIQQQRGRVVDSPGDNLLAEFASVLEAVRCAVEIQEELKARNAELPSCIKKSLGTEMKNCCFYVDEGITNRLPALKGG